MNIATREGGVWDLMQMYDTKLAMIQLKRIRNEIVNLKMEHTNINFQALNDRLDFLEDILHLYDDEIEVINISRSKDRKGR